MMADETFTKADLDKAVADAIEEATAGLKDKVNELIGDNKKLKTEARKAKDVDPAEVERLHNEVEELQTKLTAAEKAAKDADKARETAVKNLETEQGFTQRLLIQDGLKSALIANGVKDEDYLDTLAAKFAQGATVKIDGENRTALIGDKPLDVAIKEWAGSDAGKKFVAAPVNGGGGAGGGGKGGTGLTKTQAEVDAMKPAERAKFFTVDGGKIAQEV